MKNFCLKRKTGAIPFVLLNLEAQDATLVEYKPFSEFTRWMRNHGYAQNTIEVYSGHVARFIDFLYEASKVDVGTNEIADLISYYQSYLLHAQDSDIPIVRELCTRLDKVEPTAVTSIAQGIEASISAFVSHQLEQSHSIDEHNIFSKFVMTVERSRKELNAVNKHDWLSATVRGGLNRCFTNRRKTKIFSLPKRAGQKSKSKKITDEEFYPFDKITDLLTHKQERKTKFYHRDMAIYSFLAASGCRSHECFQIRTNHINFDKRQVILVDPFDDPPKGLSPSEFDNLDWKGRATEQTLLLEPFATFFWYHLHNYLKHTFQTNVSHDFIFQKGNGRPYFVTKRSDRNTTFRRYAVRSGLIIKSDRFGLHTLRHSYGRYALNYYPTSKGHGLPLAYVKILMGHQSIKSTEIYALHDTEILDAYIEAANRHIKGQSLTIKEIKINYIEQKIKQLEDKKDLL